MDVKISYGIDLKKVPDKIRSMLTAFNAEEVDHVIHIATQLLELSDANATIVSGLIDQARLKMAELDRALNDSQMILKGYIATLEADEAPMPPTTGVPNAD